MLTHIDNRYRITKFLGEGAMGKVYLVEDELKDHRQMALKTIRTSISGTDLIRHLKNEFQLLAHLCHPNLCEVYDFGFWRGDEGSSAFLDADDGVENGIYYFTMEYIDGSDFLTATEHLTEFELYPLIVQVCQALSYIHSRNFIHYDIKPSNVWVTREGKIKLMDLGLAREQEVGSNMRLRGTVNYIAPEIIRGDPVDPRADLYSLGVMLYQVVAHELPFSAPSSVEVLKKHVSEYPVKLTLKVPGVSPELSQLVMRLLQKHPMDRFTSANALLRILCDMAHIDCEESSVELRTSYILSSKFVGREAEFDRLKTALEQIQNKNITQFFLISGAAGIGKSHLMREFRYHTQLNGVTLIEGNCYTEGSQAYQPFHDILKTLVRQSRPETLGKYGSELVKLIPDVKTIIEIEPSPELNAEEEQTRLIREITAFIFDIATRKPLVLYINDLHWADTSTLQLVQALVRTAELKLEKGKAPHLLICASYCTEGASDDQFDHLCAELQRSPHICQQINLPGLPAEAVAAMVESMFGFKNLPAVFLEKIVKETDGNPFFVEEMMKSMLEVGILTQADDQWQVDVAKLDQLELPKTVAAALQRRLATLSPEKRTFLSLFSVIGRPVSLRGIEMLMAAFDPHLKGEQLAELLQSLQRQNLIKFGNGFYSISHQQIMSLLVTEIPAAERPRYHRIAAETLEKLHPNGDEFIEELAIHSYRGELWGRALRYSILAGDKNRAIYSNHTAIDFYQNALEILKRDEFRNREQERHIYRQLSHLYDLTGQVDQRLHVLNVWLEATSSNIEKAEILEMLAKSYEVIKDDYDRALKYTQEGLEWVKNEPVCPEIANLYQRMGSIHQTKGDYSSAIEYFEKSLRIFQELEDQLGEARMSRNLGTIYRLKGDYPTAQTFYETSLKIAEASESLKEKELTYRALGTLYFYWQDYDRALGYYHKGYKIVEDMDDVYGQASYFNNLGGVHRVKGEQEKALEYYQKSLDIYKEIGVARGVSVLYNNIGLLYLNQSKYEQALDYYFRSLEISQRIGHLESQAAALNNVGIIYRVLKNYDKAVEYYQKSLTISTKLGDLRSVSELYFNMAEMYHRRNQLDTARQLYEKAFEVGKDVDDLPTTADCLTSIAGIYRTQGAFSTAMEYVEQALSYLEHSENYESKESCLNELARIHLWQGDYAQAVAVMEKALKLRPDASDWERTEIFTGAGDLYRILNQVAKSQFYYQKALDAHQAANEKEGSGTCFAGLGKLALLQKKYDLAEDFYQKALSPELSILDEDEEIQTKIDLARLYLEQDQLDQADRLLVETMQQTDDLTPPRVICEIYVLKSLILAKQLATEGILLDKALTLSSDIKFAEAKWMLFRDFAVYFNEKGDTTSTDHYLNEAKAIIKRLGASLNDRVAEKTYFNQRYRRSVLVQLIRQKADVPDQAHFTEGETETLNEFEQELQDLRAFLRSDAPSAETKLKYVSAKLSVWTRMTRAIKNIQNHSDRNPYFSELMKTTRMLVRMTDDYSKLLEIIQILNSSLILDDLLIKIVDLAIDFAQSDSGSIMLYNPDGDLEIRVARDRWQQHLTGEIYPFSWTIVDQVISSKEPVCVTDIVENKELQMHDSIADIGLQSVMCLPLRRRLLKTNDEDQTGEVQDNLLGVLYLDIYTHQLHEESRFSEENINLLQTLADQASIALINASLYEKTNSDRLTRLYLRPYFEEMLKIELNLAKKHDQPLSILKIDINGSKAMNRIHGREAGDRVLEEIAQILKHSVSSTDLCARYGGDEFAILLPNTDRAQAQQVASKILETIKHYAFSCPDVSVGLGIAGFPFTGTIADQLQLQAEQAIFIAKSRGLNQMAVWEESALTDWKDQDHVPDILTGDPIRDYQNVKMLLEAIEVANSTLDMDKLLIRIVDIILKITNAERCILMLAEDGQPLKVRVARNFEGENIQVEGTYSLSIPEQVYQQGDPISLNESGDISFTESMVDLALRAAMCVPLEVKAKRLGVLYVDTHLALREFSKSDLAFLHAISRQLAAVIENASLHKRELEEEEEKIRRLEEEKLNLKKLLEGKRKIIGNCEAMEAVFSAIHKVAQTDATVLIYGESGTGKESVAHSIHNLSHRMDQPFVIVDCGAIPENLIESELFGHEKGAFTGAYTQKKGKFELANKGTIFLDEIGELPLHLQVKLLRVLQESEITRIGGRQPIKLDIRVIAATNRNLEQEIEEKTFRTDLYYRLNTVQIDLPPLRERGSDVILLANFFLNRFGQESHKKIKGFTKEAIAAMEAYEWPGNIRELEHKIERAVIMTENQYLTPEDLQLGVDSVKKMKLKEAREQLEIQYLRESLTKHQGNVTYAAEDIGISRVRFHQLLDKYGIDREAFTPHAAR